MLVFITHPKYFDPANLKRKKVDLIYIFNSKSLFNELSKKYKCVNIGYDYTIINENFFPQEVYTNKLLILKIFNFRSMVLQYYFKTKYKILSKRHMMIHGFRKDPIMRLTLASAKKMFKKDANQAMKDLNDSIYRQVSEIIQEEVDPKYYEKYKDTFPYFFNLADSFYRAYIYSFEGLKRGAEVTADILKYNYALNAIKYYRPNYYDIYEGRFHYNYLKVLSRLFIENIHKNSDLKDFTFKNIEFWSEE